MVRTVADGKKAVGSKAPRKQLGCGGGGSSSMNNIGSPSSNNPNFGLTNHAKMWPTPAWQKGISNFFKKCDTPTEEDSSSSSSCQSVTEGERMDADDVIVTACGSSSGGSAGTSSSTNHRLYSDEEDKENIDPSSSPEDLRPKMKVNGDDGDESRSESGSPSPKARRKANGKQKAGPSKRKKRMVLQEDSDYEEDGDDE